MPGPEVLGSGALVGSPQHAAPAGSWGGSALKIQSWRKETGREEPEREGSLRLQGGSCLLINKGKETQQQSGSGRKNW